MFYPGEYLITAREIPGVYALVNTVTGVSYFGSSVHIRNRLSTQVWLLRNGEGRNDRLQADWDQYGEHKFEAKIIVIIENKDELIRLEQWCIDHYPCYNIRPAGNQPGFKLNPETAQRIGDSNRGNRRSGVALSNLIDSNQRRAGRVVSEETRERMRQSALNRKTRDY